jgi:hypothetical protein
MKVLLVFDLNEEVTPELFCEKIARACSKGGAIRPGESVSTVNLNFVTESSIEFKAIEPVEVQSDFPFQLHEYIERVYD